jgi:TfoX/Sxy family transcriptional regulator of competence genes
VKTGKPSGTETMDYLAERVRDIVGPHPSITEKMMFGGITFLLNGHILVGCKKDGQILLSVGKEHYETALGRPGTTPMSHSGRSMTGFVWVEPDAIEDEDDLKSWVDFALRAVGGKPPKEAKPAARKAPAKKAAARKKL